MEKERQKSMRVCLAKCVADFNLAKRSYRVVLTELLSDNPKITDEWFKSEFRENEPSILIVSCSSLFSTEKFHYEMERCSGYVLHDFFELILA